MQKSGTVITLSLKYVLFQHHFFVLLLKLCYIIIYPIGNFFWFFFIGFFHQCMKGSGYRNPCSFDNFVKMGQWDVRWSWLLPPGAQGNIQAEDWINFTQFNSVSVVGLCPWSWSLHATQIHMHCMPCKAFKLILQVKYTMMQ